MIDSKLEKHWENVHSKKKENEVSWYQILPHKSIEIIKSLNLNLDSNIIDIEVEMALKDKPDRTYRFRVFRSEEDIPTQQGWYRGDTHLHSIYTQNDAETGLPLCATKGAAKLLGLDWITTTDHTSDIDNYGQSIIYNWNRILQDIEQNNLDDNSMLYIPGQEVAVENSAGKLVHMLAYPGYSNPKNFPFLGKDFNGS